MNRLKAAWNLLTKGNSYWGQQNPGSLKIIGGQVSWINDNFDAYIQQGYSANDIVYSIGHITGEKIKVAPWDAYKVKDEQALKMMYKLQREDPAKHYRKILDLRHKSLELFTGDGKLTELLQWPNEDESFSDIVAHSSIAKMMLGNRYLQAILLDMGINRGKPQELRLLPAQFTRIINNQAYPLRAIGYQMTATGGPPINLTREEVMHDKYYNMTYDTGGSQLYGLAPLKAAARNLCNDNASMSRSTASFQNGGPAVIVFTDDQRMTADQSLEQAMAVKNRLLELEGDSGANKAVSSGYKMGVAQMGLSPVDLNILQQQKWSMIKFCAVWNFPAPLINPEHSTYNNVKEAEKALTNRCAMPLLTSFRDNFNRKLQSDWGYKGKNIICDFDQTVYPELQQEQGEVVAWLEKCWWIPAKMKYEIQNLEVPDYLDEAILEKIYLPMGLTELGAEDAHNQSMLDEILASENGNGQLNGKPKPVKA